MARRRMRAAGRITLATLPGAGGEEEGEVPPPPGTCGGDPEPGDLGRRGYAGSGGTSRWRRLPNGDASM
jgi:hypothetical protein